MPTNASLSHTARKPLYTLLHTTANTPLVHQDATPCGEQISSDIQDFCTLLARILLRCLKEGDEQVLDTLSLAANQNSKE